MPPRSRTRRPRLDRWTPMQRPGQARFRPSCAAIAEEQVQPAQAMSIVGPVVRRRDRRPHRQAAGAGKHRLRLVQRSTRRSPQPGSPSRARTSPTPRPTIRTRLARPCSPEMRVTARRGRSRLRARRSRMASFAAPSTGGALTRTSRAPARTPPRPGREALGLARTESSTAPETSRTTSATACPPSSGRGTTRCRPPGPEPRRRARQPPRAASGARIRAIAARPRSGPAGA